MKAKQIHGPECSDPSILETLESIRTGYDPTITAPKASFDLFGEADAPIGEGAVFLPWIANPIVDELLRFVKDAGHVAPFRPISTPAGLGVWTQAGGDDIDPVSARPWPPIPELVLDFARHAARQAGFFRFTPTVCRIQGFRMGDGVPMQRDETAHDLSQPLVMVSLGVPATFLLGGKKPGGRVDAQPWAHGDVVVLGGKSRLRYFGVRPQGRGTHPATGPRRISLTLLG